VLTDPPLQAAAAPATAPGADEEDRRDRQLLQRIAVERDAGALEVLYGRYRERLPAFLRRLSRDSALIEEVYNDVMVKVWDKAHQFQGQSRVSSWIYSIAYRDCLRMVKKQQRRDLLVQLVGQEVPDTDLACEPESVDLPVDRALLQQAMHKLPPKQRLVLELCYFEGHAIEDIARIVSAPANTVKTRLHHARNKVRAYLVRHGAALDA
jgi:RNA polymerase sigma-70 factor (ECF subfamily)